MSKYPDTVIAPATANASPCSDFAPPCPRSFNPTSAPPTAAITSPMTVPRFSDSRNKSTDPSATKNGFVLTKTIELITDV